MCLQLSYLYMTPTLSSEIDCYVITDGLVNLFLTLINAYYPVLWLQSNKTVRRSSQIETKIEVRYFKKFTQGQSIQKRIASLNVSGIQISLL